MGGGHGGHNGIRDIDRHLGQDYWRVRMGVGRPEQVIPGSRIDIKKWVLMDFAREEEAGWLSDLLRAMADEAERLTQHDDGGFMSRLPILHPLPNCQAKTMTVLPTFPANQKRNNHGF